MNCSLAELPAISCAVHVTMVSPNGKFEPLVGVQVAVSVPSVSSMAVTVYRTKAPEDSSPRTVNDDGTVMTGGVVSDMDVGNA